METTKNPSESGDEGSVAVVVETQLLNENKSENEIDQTKGIGSSNFSDSLAQGLSTTLATVIKDFDSKAELTLNSQHQLNSALDRLTRELDQLLEDAPLPFIMQHAVKISGVKKRVSSLNSLLKSIQRRLDNIDLMLSVASAPQEKTAAQNLSHDKN